ncbi:MAG: hypothetical protein ABI699_10145 [Caldimonas sp.]
MKTHTFLPMLGLAAAALLAGCGGGGSDPAPLPPAVPPASVLQGTAATGAALANAQVSIVDGAGAGACQEASLVTSGTGSFTCTLKAGESAPFFVSVTDPSGTVAPMVSVTTQTPTPGTPLVVNATPLTTAILAQLAADHDALGIFNAHAVDAAALALTTSRVIAQLQPVLIAIGAPAGYDPFTTRITAASTAGAGNTVDLVLDVVKVGTDSTGNLTLGTIDNPSGVAMASASQAGTPLPATDPAVSSLALGMQALGQAFEQCFALPVAQRALATDTTIPYSMGGSSVTQAAAACQPIADDAFRQNGFDAGQIYYGILTSDSMTGAKFSVPQVMQFLPKASTSFGYDTAIVNIRYVDANGIAGNSITLAADKGTAATPHWLLYGNQQPINMVVRASIRRQQQQAPVTQAPFNTTATLGTFQSGIELFVDKDGPGSTNLSAVRVKGPGLPASGLLLNRPIASAEAQQSWLNIADKSGADPGVVATRRTNCSCDIFYLQRTQDVSGAGATALRSNPNGGNANAGQFVYWAHPLDYGAAAGTSSDIYVPLASLAPGASYQVEVFYGDSGMPTYAFSKTLLSPVIPATRGVFLPWNTPSPATLDILDPANPLAAATTAFSVGWTQNPSAEQIRLAQAFTYNGANVVNQGVGVNVPKSALSVVVPAPAGLQYPVLDSSGASARQIQFLYRTFDNSLKLASYRFN